jgi:hypothetical protein
MKKQPRQYNKLSALRRLALQIMFIDTRQFGRLTERELASFFGVARMTVRNHTANVELRRGAIAEQAPKLRQLFECLAGPVGTDGEWEAILQRAYRIAADCRAPNPVTAASTAA